MKLLCNVTTTSGKNSIFFYNFSKKVGTWKETAKVGINPYKMGILSSWNSILHPFQKSLKSIWNYMQSHPFHPHPFYSGPSLIICTQPSMETIQFSVVFETWVWHCKGLSMMSSRTFSITAVLRLSRTIFIFLNWHHLGTWCVRNIKFYPLLGTQVHTHASTFRQISTITKNSTTSISTGNSFCVFFPFMMFIKRLTLVHLSLFLYYFSCSVMLSFTFL